MGPNSESPPPRAFAWELVAAFAFAGLLAIGVIELMRFRAAEISFTSLTQWQYAFVGVIAVIVIVSVLRKIRTRLIWELLFTTTLFLGVWYLALLTIPFAWGMILASVLTLLALILRTGIWHNLLIIVGCLGVAVNFAGWLSPDVLLVGLVVMTLYDTLAGQPGGPVEDLAKRLVQKGIVPGLILVRKMSDLRLPISRLVQGDNALLGAGDLVLPLSLVARAALTSWTSAAIVLVGLLVGAIVLGRGSLHPRAALLPLAVGAAIPFFVLRLLGSI